MENERRRRGDGVRCVRKKMRKRRVGFVDTMRCVEIERAERGRIDRYPKTRVWFLGFGSVRLGSVRFVVVLLGTVRGRIRMTDSCFVFFLLLGVSMR